MHAIAEAAVAALRVAAASIALHDPATGRLVVNATAGAEVFIDGESVGTAPLGELEVPVGLRSIVVRHPDLGEKRATMDVKRDQTAEITLGATSEPARQAAPRLAPLSAPPAPRGRE